MDEMVAERYKLMTPERRMRIASSMFETARAIIESSLPLNLTRRERRLAFAKRLYAGELPDAALLAFAEWDGGHFISARQAQNRSTRRCTTRLPEQSLAYTCPVPIVVTKRQVRI